MAQHATKLAAAQKLSDAREALKSLSTDAIGLAKSLPGYYVMTCSMVKADWLQNTKEVANPYGENALPKCGSIKGN